MNSLMHPFIPQLAPTVGARVDAHRRAMRGPEMGFHNGRNPCDDTFTARMNTELPRGATAESSGLAAPVDGSRGTPGMQMGRDEDRELASFFPSPSTHDLTVVTVNAEDALRHAVVQYQSHTLSWRYG